MEKKIAIAVDESVQSMEAVQYAADLSTRLPGLRFDLLNVQPPISQYLTDEARRKPSARKALEEAMEKNASAAMDLLSKAAERLAVRGVSEDHIHRLALPRNTGVANDILAISQTKSYDAVLVGRRGTSYLREWVMGSVTANLVAHSKLVPIWVVDGEVRTGDILLAADGSNTSLRALDHLAFMLSGSDHHNLHVLHVQPRFQDYCKIDLEAEAREQVEASFQDDENKCMDDFHARALEVLDKNNVDRDRFKLETMAGALSVPRTIVQYANDAGIGTLVMGRHGRGNNLFTGSVSRGLLYKATDMALWVVP